MRWPSWQEDFHQVSVSNSASVRSGKGSPIGFSWPSAQEKTVVPLVAGFTRPADIPVEPTHIRKQPCDQTLQHALRPAIASEDQLGSRLTKWLRYSEGNFCLPTVAPTMPPMSRRIPVVQEVLDQAVHWFHSVIFFGESANSHPAGINL